jgi:hypothetical protein
MKRFLPGLIFTIILLVFIGSAGCSSKEVPVQHESIQKPSVTMTHPTLNSDQLTPQNNRIPPSPQITRPRISPGLTIPSPSTTKGSMLYENASEIMVTAQQISDTWDPDGLTCNENSCTAGFINTNGDSVTVQTTLYNSIDAAKTGYNAEKQKDITDRIVPLEIPDESYGWVQKSQSKVVFRKSNVVVLVNYNLKSGPTSMDMAQGIAMATSLNL